mmetsp:Transcript_55579/g.113125  ORF Transcript_55579/g.113125 Transcript_55579/m.113125 type:complete len:582 (-) Transcript_55579:353-2098(-)
MAGGSFHEIPRRTSESSTCTEWVNDSATDVCMNCHARFGVMQLRRKHHCRRCGKVVCSTCSRSRELVLEYHPAKPQRVCNSCVAAPPIAENPEEAASAALEAVKAGKHAKPLSAASLCGMPVPSCDEHREFATLQVRVIEAKGLLAADFNLVSKKSSDPYCLLRVGHGVQVRTCTVGATLEPRWDVTTAFRVSRLDSFLHLEVWDEDTATRDDALGFLDLSLAKVPLSRPFRGWVPLRPPEAQPLPGEDARKTPATGAGAVLLEVQMLDVKPVRRFQAFVSPLPPVPPPLPHFDIDAVYGPAMHLVDLIWSRFLSPILFWILDLIFWASPTRTLFALILWNVGAKYCLEHYPAFFPLGLLCFMLRHYFHEKEEAVRAKRPTLVRKRTAPAILEESQAGSEHGALSRQDSRHADYDEAQLGSAVQSLCFVLPGSVKDLCRGLQPLLRTAADGVQTIHDIFVWDHDASPFAAIALLLWAVLAEVLRFDLYLMLIGSSILLACSPLLPAVSGFSAYLSLLRAKTQPEEWGMRSECAEEWLSKDYLDVKGLASASTSGSPSRQRLRHGKTMPVLSPSKAAERSAH